MNGNSYAIIGFTTGTLNLITNLSSTGADDWWYDSDGRTNTNGSPAETTGEPTWYSASNTVMACVDTSNGKMWFKDKNGAWLTAANDAAVASGTSPDFTGGAATYYPLGGHMGGAHNSNIITANFGETSFVHSIPSGFTSWDVP